MNCKNIAMAIIATSLFLITACENEPESVATEFPAGPDTIFVNGKIVTVDDEFSIANALAVKDGRIVAVGANEQVSSLASSATRLIDLQGKTVIPGLIDNHIHFIRAGQRWNLQARIDGVNKRQEALDIISEKAANLEPGEWLMVQGGWFENQFSDIRGGFTLEELDTAAPNNPLFLQIAYFKVYANTLALEAVGVDPAGGAVYGGPDLISPQPPYGLLNEQMPEVSKDQIKQNVRDVIAQFNKAGLTSVYDVGRPPEGDIDLLQEMSEDGPLNLRVWHTLKYEAYNAEEGDQAIALINNTEPNATDDYLGILGVGEHLYLPFFDLPGFKDVYSDEIVSEFGRISRAAAEKGFKVNEHTMMDQTINSALDEWEKINQDIPLAPLRWSIEHVMSMSDETILRAKNLGVTAAAHSVAMTLPSELQPPMRRMQDMGLIWGLGSDGTIVAHFQPFITLGWAVSGRSISGLTLTEETLTREEALVAHTRSNAYLLHKDEDLGSLEVGKLADLVVLDKDYMTVPEGEIFYLQSEMTMVGGRIVFDAAND